MKRTSSTLEPAMVAREGEVVLSILQERQGLPTKVVLRSGKALMVYNIAWGRDLGENFDHITSNISPRSTDEHSVDFFHTCDVVAIVAMEDGKTLFSFGS